MLIFTTAFFLVVVKVPLYHFELPVTKVEFLLEEKMKLNKTKKIFVLSMAFLLAFGASAKSKVKDAESMTEDENARILNVMAKIRRGEDVCIAAFGGSITSGYNSNPLSENSWRALVGKWWQAKAKEYGANVKYMHEAVSGTDSAFGAARAQFHLLDNNVDLVFLEFAMNDQWLEASVRNRSYEGIIRQIENGSEAGIFALFVNEKNPPQSSQQKEQQPICEYYHIPFVSWKDCLFATDKKDFEGFFDGEEGVHPNNAGHAKIAEYMTAKLETVWKNLPSDSEIPENSKNLPEVLTDRGFENAVYYTKDNIQSLTNTGWTEGSPVHSEWTSHGRSHEGWQTKTAGAEIVFEVTGSAVGITYCESDQFRDPIAWVEYEDGKTSTKLPLNCYVSYRKGYYGWAYKELVSTDSVQKFKVHIQCNKRASKDKDGKSTNITGILVAGEK